MSWDWHPSDGSLSACHTENRARHEPLTLRNKVECEFDTHVRLSKEVCNEQLGTAKSSSKLLAFPNEILTFIFTFISNTAPSSRGSLSKPEYDLTLSTDQPLKQISLTNLRLRRLVLPILFRHARLDPCHLPAFLTFIRVSDISRHITSVVVQLQGPQNHIHPPWWARLLDHLPNLDSLTVFAAPHVFAEIGQVPIDTSHSWAFKIPYQTLTLGMERIPLTHLKESSAKQRNVSQKTSFAPLHSVLTVKSWTNLTVNESSHLPAYSTYEYFLKIPPSLIISLYHRQKAEVRIQPQTFGTASSIPKQLVSASMFLESLLSFRYIAIFPFYNHVDEVLKCVQQMKRLRKLFVKLCPEPESTVLRDELERNSAGAGRTEGRIDVNDPWNEFETSYTLIPHTIIYLTTDGSLEEFETDDVKMIGIRDSLIEGISRRLDGLSCWAHIREGIWVKSKDARPLAENDTNQVEERREDGSGRIIE